ncbi:MULTISPECIES: class II fructose-bisphosphate aldolase [unclassified Streptomyces]|uniref:class II fructose-bisphosphate aldolase n=1 Tax=unclassified Streptomyces TaxID=2593676 RepID=UPI00236664F8|nr:MULTISPECIES: class II fructose-bisphosphate aldolase [unclassified Streptomyces]MDF3144008.1 class II fructose-bisphosphate aldolase [Streptomyces sp. T21Q-yed]WDF38175.1 class II fructose-bisphosphate aldolase [Streptomyces sp. T12]
MLLTGPEGLKALTTAYETGRALPGFVAYNLETVQGIVAAAEANPAHPVVLQAGSSPFKHAGREPLMRLALDAAADSHAALGVHLDHSRDLDEITACLKAGYTSVMVDGSHLPFAENIALTREAVRRARDHGAWVEAELGALAGDEDVSTDADAATAAMTDPAQAAEFVTETGVDALAVAVGNVHGFTATPVRLDLDRLSAIHLAVPVPLVLHGASGLPEHQLLGALTRGVAKINVNAELRRAYLQAVSAELPTALPGSDVVSLWSAGRNAVAAAASRIIGQLT